MPTFCDFYTLWADAGALAGSMAGVRANSADVLGGVQDSYPSSTVLNVANCTPTACNIAQEFHTKNAFGYGW